MIYGLSDTIENYVDSIVPPHGAGGSVFLDGVPFIDAVVYALWQQFEYGDVSLLGALRGKWPEDVEAALPEAEKQLADVSRGIELERATESKSVDREPVRKPAMSVKRAPARVAAMA